MSAGPFQSLTTVYEGSCSTAGMIFEVVNVMLKGFNAERRDLALSVGNFQEELRLPDPSFLDKRPYTLEKRFELACNYNSTDHIIIS
jgi:hypothetical protein